MFGYPVEADFDFAKEQRRDRLGWALIGGTILSLVCLFFSPIAIEIFQGYVATVLCYGENFYVRRKEHLGKVWLWKAIFATVPLHVLYLAGLFWSGKMFPTLMTKAIVFIPVLALAFAIEAILIDWIVDRFKPSCAHQTESF